MAPSGIGGEGNGNYWSFEHHVSLNLISVTVTDVTVIVRDV